jgi:2-methylcitrate dehydratase PrpD
MGTEGTGDRGELTGHLTETLATFAAGLRFDDIPGSVERFTEDLFLDWFGCALAGKGARPVEAIEAFARQMGPQDGKAEVLVSRRTTTPLFAALVNAASSHVAELDDVHTGAVLHPGTVVFPVVLALAQDVECSGRELLTAAVAGYEVGIRVGEFLGPSHYKVFHTTGTAGTLAAAAAAGRLLQLPPEGMLQAFGTAGTQAAGLWEFLRDAGDSKPLHAAKAAADGLSSAYLASRGLTGARRILEGARGMGRAMSADARPDRLTDRLGARWAILETSFKYYASCRHTHPAADAFLKIVLEHDLGPENVETVVAHVHQAAIDVLGVVTDPQTVSQAKFSMGTVLALVAHFRRAGLDEFAKGFDAPSIVHFRDRVSMVLDDEVDRAYPAQWIGKVTVHTTDGRTLCGRMDVPKGDPGNTLSPAEVREKSVRLALASGAATADEMDRVAATIRRLPAVEQVGPFLPCYVAR